MGVPAGYEPTAISIARGAFNQDTRALLVDLATGDISIDTVTIDTDPITGEGVDATSLHDLSSQLDVLADGVKLSDLATAAKQPALGTAGHASADVLSIQGIGGGTAVPVSGTFALESGGNLATLATVVSAGRLLTTPNTTRGSGAIDGTTERVVLATDSPGVVGMTAIGALTDAPVSDSTTKESATSRSGVSLWKRLINVLIDSLAAFVAVNQSIVRASSGLTTIVTTTNAVAEVLAANGSATYYHVRIANEGSVAGFYSIDGGTTWGRLPANTVIKNDGVKIENVAVQVKRVPDGANLTGVYGEAW